MKKRFIVKLFDCNDNLLEYVIVFAKGKKTASKMAKFKSQIGWDYSIKIENI